MKPFDLTWKSNRVNLGFTLVELLIVLLLVAILAAVTAPRFFGTDVFGEFNARENLQSALGFAKNRALTSQCSIELRIEDSGWTAFRDENCDTDTAEPGCPSTNAPLNFTVSLANAYSAPLTDTQPHVSSSDSPQRLIFTPDSRLYLLTNPPSEDQCTTLGNEVAAGTDITLSDGTTLALDGATAYASMP